MKLHRFTAQGLVRFHQFLDSLAADPRLPVAIELLTDPEAVELVAPGVELESRVFADRMDAAKYLDQLLTPVLGDVLRDVGLWSWLTLFYFDQVCPVENGKRKLGERARYVPAIDNFQKYYRHLLSCRYRAYRAHRDAPERAAVLLVGPLHVLGEMTEQIMSRQEYVTNRSAMAAATYLFVDSEGKYRRGARGESARRLADVLNQFDVTWDLYWMKPQGIAEKLPKEFERFRAAADRQ